VARGAADEVARAGRCERDLGVLVAVGLDGVAGRARAVVRGAHLRHRVHPAVLEHCVHACALSASDLSDLVTDMCMGGAFYNLDHTPTYSPRLSPAAKVLPLAQVA
jgi:hypothetical protein